MGIGHGHQDVVGLQISVDWRERMKVRQKNKTKKQVNDCFWGEDVFWLWECEGALIFSDKIPMFRECRWASPDMVC